MGASEENGGYKLPRRGETVGLIDRLSRSRVRGVEHAPPSPAVKTPSSACDVIDFVGGPDEVGDQPERGRRTDRGRQCPRVHSRAQTGLWEGEPVGPDQQVRLAFADCDE